MKITKFYLSIALVALATTSFGQLSSIKERLFNKQNNNVEYISAEYNRGEESKIESWMFDLRSWSTNRASRDTYVAPVVTYCINLEYADVVFEDEINLEVWMSTPFETSLVEENQSLETWMTAPFESAEFIEKEDWMATVWL